MTFLFYLSLFASLMCGGAALLIFLQEPRSFIHRIFSLGMLTLALGEVFGGMRVSSQTVADFIFWERLHLISEGLFPGIWLVFSLSFGRSNYKELLSKWKWVIVASFIFPLSLLSLFYSSFFKGFYSGEDPTVLTLPLGWSGYLFYLVSLISFIVVLVNLEGTLRSSAGIKRWRIKFLILGVGGLFAVNIYSASQTILFSSVNLSESFLGTYGAIFAAVFVLVSLVRSRFSDVDIYVSTEFLYKSLTMTMVGIYLLTVGILAKLISNFPGNKVFSLSVFFVFLSMVILTLILMSDRIQQEIKRFLYRNFYRSRYDYRKQWSEFTEGTASKVNARELCLAVTKMVSDSFGSPSVTIWLMEEPQDQLALGGSTAFSEAGNLDLKLYKKDFESLLRLVRSKFLPVDMGVSNDPQISELKSRSQEFIREARIRYCVPLFTGEKMLGILTLSNPLTGQSFSIEEFDLLKVIAGQTAGSLLNLKLSQNLIKAKELEAFQSLSAFFIHDLKNLASTLSLTLKNLPLHYQDAEFREDALQVISKSVEKMNGMCSRLTLLTKRLDLAKVETDLNGLIQKTIQEVEGSLGRPVVRHLLPLPGVIIDPEQIQKVLINLILNASEAISGTKGEIQIKTETIEGEKVCLSVKDNGCGISEEFLSSSLFQPFQTTKSQGLGIGLYHSKMIVEAHQGKIEVESQKGVGTTFKVILPMSLLLKQE
jgi:putative PEP-CTERM system histidine kinase